jgi:formylglycine-generating enzyme required for sulfatase activity
LALAPRIEPLLLRNARLHFVPKAQAEVESLLWFSPLVAARSTSEIVFHLGVSKTLAQECEDEERTAYWEFTQKHTRHWSAEDRLERDLRYYALQQDQAKLTQGLREILRRIHAESGENSLALSRLVKRTLSVIAPKGGGNGEALWLAQYAALALGDAGAWVQPGEPQALPDWLRVKLPDLPASIPKAELGLEIRADGSNQVLHFIAADKAKERIPLPSPLPAQLHVASLGPGAWHTVSLGTRIAIKPPSQHLRLTTLDGQQWDLRTENWQQGKADVEKADPPPLWLVHTEADTSPAQAIAEWLQAQGVDVQLQVESALSTSSNIPSPHGGGLGRGQSKLGKVVRLWTQAAHRYWAERPVPEAEAVAEGLLLRIENVDLPRLGTAQGQVLEWLDWTSLDSSPKAQALLDKLRRWWEGGEIEPDEGQSEFATPTETFKDDANAQNVSDGVANPVTPNAKPLSPPGRGVGERGKGSEQKVPKQEQGKQQTLNPKIQSLLDEINNPATEPPRRLAIGDELEQLGDPRRGVGLDANGLPDIEWIEIPSGPFIYQNGETRELPTYWISRYPITNRQFRAFIDAGGYQNQTDSVFKTESVLAELWKDLLQPQPAKSTWPQGNRPRTNVDWYEAVAYTRWLSAVLGLKAESIRLPTEQEWEKVARGTSGMVYPWGNKYRSGFANIDEKYSQVGPWYLEQTTAVGLYPHSKSPYHIEDLSGTVWEWCLNKYDKTNMTEADTSGDSRVVRGGSWLRYRVLARADYRLRYGPVIRNGYGGFRVLSVVPIHADR